MNTKAGKKVIRTIVSNIIIGSLLWSLISCFSTNEYRLTHKNKVDWENLYSSKSILMPDTNAIYLYRIIHESEDSTNTYYSFRRYFGRGRVYTSKSFKEHPTEQDFNEMKTDSRTEGSKHYYSIMEDGVLIEEIFINKSEGYHYIYSNIYPDSIVHFKRQHGRGFFGKCCAVKYNIHIVGIRKDFELINFNVDW